MIALVAGPVTITPSGWPAAAIGRRGERQREKPGDSAEKPPAVPAEPAP